MSDHLTTDPTDAQEVLNHYKSLPDLRKDALASHEAAEKIKKDKEDAARQEANKKISEIRTRRIQSVKKNLFPKLKELFGGYEWTISTFDNKEEPDWAEFCTGSYDSWNKITLRVDKNAIWWSGIYYKTGIQKIVSLEQLGALITAEDKARNYELSNAL